MRRSSTTRRRLAGILGGVALLVAVTVLVRQDVPTADPSALAPPDGEISCTGPYAADGLQDRSFALLGTVSRPPTGPDLDGRTMVQLDVERWYRGPALDRFEVRLPGETVAGLEGDGGQRLQVGQRLLVAGDRWRGPNPPFGPVAWGCGWTRTADEAAQAQWADAVPAARTPDARPDELTAMYAAVGYLADSPGLRGILVRDGDCLYVQDGQRRWVPVFPDDGSTRWRDAEETLEHGGIEVGLGTLTALGGAAAAPPAETADAIVVPAGCDPGADRWVVAEPRGGEEPSVVDVPYASPMVRSTVAALAVAGIDGELTGATRTQDVYGRTSTMVSFETSDGDLAVTVESLPFSVTFDAYAPRPGELELRRLDGVQVGVVRPADGRYLQAVARLRSGIVAIVTAHPGADGSLTGSDQVAGMAAAMVLP